MFLIDQPLKPVLHWSNTIGRIAKWAIELIEFDIKFRPHPSIKAQILADSILEYTILKESPKKGKPIAVVDGQE